MKTTQLLTGLLGGVLLAASTSFAATPGQGFDAFGARDLGSGVGENIIHGAYMGTSLGGTAGQGWDVYSARDIGSGVGEPLPTGRTGYLGTAMQIPSLGYDVMGSKDPSL